MYGFIFIGFRGSSFLNFATFNILFLLFLYSLGFWFLDSLVGSLVSQKVEAYEIVEYPGCH